MSISKLFPTAELADNNSNNESEFNEIKILMKEAIEYSTTACHFEKNNNYIGACDYYDKGILTIDEVLNRLPNQSNIWSNLYTIRNNYDDRMEFLRDIENNKNNFSIISMNNNSNNRSYNNKNNSRKRSNFKEEKIDDNDNTLMSESIPHDSIQLPYWLLRNIKKTIDSGGFVADGVFVPKAVWSQSDVKIFGLQPKIQAYEIIIRLIVNNVETLYLSNDEDSLEFAELSFTNLHEELLALQNNLSKSFPYIKEATSSGKKSNRGADGNFPQELESPRVNTARTADSDSTTANFNVTDKSSNQPFTSQPTPPAEPSPRLPPTPSFAADSSTTSNRSNDLGGGSSKSNAMGGSGKSAGGLTSLVSAFGKNVRKYAEVGLQRLAVALPSRLSTDELEDYAALIAKLCEKCQVLDSWQEFMTGVKNGAPGGRSVSGFDDDEEEDEEEECDEEGSNKRAKKAGRSRGDSIASTASTPAKQSQKEPIEDYQTTSSKYSETNNRSSFTLCAAPGAQKLPSLTMAITCQNLQVKIDTVMAILENISGVLRNVLCEILLRDLEYLIEKYLADMRKAFSRMYWDDETDSNDG